MTNTRALVYQGLYGSVAERVKQEASSMPTYREKSSHPVKDTLHEKQHFRKNAQRQYHFFVIFRTLGIYHILRKTNIKENNIISIIYGIFRNK